MPSEWYPEGEQHGSEEALQQRYESFTSLEGSFEQVIHSLMIATIDVGGITKEQREAMITAPNFWRFHSKLVQDLEAVTPGITKKIFEQAEVVHNARLQESREHEAEVARKMAKRAFWRALIGRPPVY